MPHKLAVLARGRRNGWRNERLLGKTFLDREHEVVLQIGTDAWTRDEIVTQLKTGHMNAARLLSKAAEKLQVANARQMAARVSLDDLWAVERVGITTVVVWLCVLEAMRENPESWVDRDNDDDDSVTLNTRKIRLKKAKAQAEAQNRDVRRPARPARQSAAAPAE